MVLTKSYLRYVEAGIFGVVGSARANVCLVQSGEKRREICLAIVPALENVYIWDARLGEKVNVLQGNKSEVTCLCLSPDSEHLAVGYGDGVIRIWNINNGTSSVTFRLKGHKGMYKDDRTERREDTRKRKTTTQSSEDGVGEIEEFLSCTMIGSVMRSSTDRVVTLYCDLSRTYIGCHGANSTLEMFRLASEDEIKKRLAKRRKKILKKQRSQGLEADELTVSENVLATVEDEIIKLPDVKTTSKIRSFDFALNSNNDLKISLLLHNNSVEFHVFNEEKKDSTNILSIKTPGHRSDVRTLSFNSDDSCILSGAAESVKLWNRKINRFLKSTQKCIRTMSSGYCLSSLFVPGDRHVVVGTKAGKLEIFDVSSGSLLETVDAHDGAIWSLCLAPDNTLFASGSGDKDVKFWEFDLITDENYSTTSQRLSICHARTLKMNDDVMCVKFSLNQKFIAVALLDFTMKIFFTDTLKFFLSLYGHKLPVVTMDISTDNVLLVSGGVDKNIKIWGLDFGDCRKSIFAHDDSVMAVKFVPKTHYFFSASKDKTIKYWDADRFLHVTTLEGHHSEIWSLAISHDGEFVISGSHDKSLRLWERTDEPLFVEEERDGTLHRSVAGATKICEREANYEESAVTGVETIIPGEQDTEAVKAGKKTIETIKGAERIMEAIELYKEERQKELEHKASQVTKDKTLPKRAIHPILAALGNVSLVQYVLLVVKKVKSSELEESLLVLPFDYVIDVLKLLLEWIKNGWETELSCRCLFFLLRIHHNKIISTPELLPVIDSIRSHCRSRVREMKDTVGFNLAGLQFIQRQLENRDVTFYFETRERLGQMRKKKKTIVRKFR
ncbi:WD repeat-containing protein 3-like [Xenia sp. Carnegie-2017]|uniref:WD repeat-containing protein 3-like n=1 Tax=Xenia sp. Carnegie-2017 TaxID=2897299 RepID=UPI001F04BF57|nr:WD repeat-containing protein 3-like [Xenia sp. Carnegie-2017]